MAIRRRDARCRNTRATACADGWRDGRWDALFGELYAELACRRQLLWRSRSASRGVDKRSADPWTLHSGYVVIPVGGGVSVISMARSGVHLFGGQSPQKMQMI
jgi:hypothetical protein